MATKRHNHQWEHTENFLSALAYLSNSEKLNVFLLALCSASIKYDGTNIAKDDEGILYSRRFVMDEEAERFQHTSLQEVNKADIQLVKRLLLKYADIEETLITKTITFGELICNRYYDYITVYGKWLNFGVKLQVAEAGKNGKTVLDKLVKNGFAAQSNIQDGFIKIFPNIKLCQIFKEANLDAVPCESEKSIERIVEKHEEDMRKGKMEGLILTVLTEEGYKLYKWKGPQEHQPATQSEFLAANRRIQVSPQTSENIKKVFSLLAGVIEDISQNDAAQRMVAKMTKGNKKELKPITENMKNRGKYLTNLDKEIIMVGIENAGRKYDSLEVYFANNEIEEYTEALILEVKQHLMDEVPQYAEMDENNTAAHFIKAKVKKTVQDKLAALSLQT